MKDSTKPQIVLPKSALTVHIGYVMEYMHEILEKPLVGFIKEFAIYGRALGVNFDHDVQAAMDLIVDERKFIEDPSLPKAQVLDAKWHDWADRLFGRLIKSAIDPHYPNLERRLHEYVDALSLTRAKFLH